MINVEDAVWQEKLVRRRVSNSTKTVESLKVGDVKRIFHYDVSCRRLNDNDYVCSLRAAVYRIERETGKLFETYHEEESVMIVRRLR